MPSHTVIHTPRLTLTSITRDAFPDIDRMHRDPRIMATLGGMRSTADSERFIEDAIAHWDAHGFGLWLAHERASGCFAGRGGLRHVIIGGHLEVEVAYAVMPEFWGQGLATELARESARVGLVLLGRPDLVCFTWVTNRVSRRVMEKVGFCYERDVMHAGLPHVLYRLRAAAWRGSS